MESKRISKAMLNRLPGYLNYLKSLPEDSVTNISATTMAKALGLGDVQVRKDLAMVSGGGRRKIGHVREALIHDIEVFLDHHNITNAVLVGVGKLGQALMDYEGFEIYGLNILAGFDINPALGAKATGKPVYTMDRLADYCREHDVPMGVIAVPVANAQDVCNQMVACGIRAIWNFAPTHLKAPEHVLIQNENLAVSLTALRVQMKGQRYEQ